MFECRTKMNNVICVSQFFNGNILRKLCQLCWDGDDLPDRYFQMLFESTALRFRIRFPECRFDLTFLEECFANQFKCELGKGCEKHACEPAALLILFRMETAFDEYITRKNDAWVIKAFRR